MGTQSTPLLPVFNDPKTVFTEFAGWRVAMSFAGILPEALNTGTRAGLFDVSHLGRVIVAGPGAPGLLDGLMVGSPDRLAENEGRYTFITNEDGGIEEDLIFLKLAPGDFFPGIRDGGYLLFTNAANHARVMARLRGAAVGRGVTLTDATAAFAMIALQGPASLDALGGGGAPELATLEKNRAVFTRCAGRSVLAVSSGYTGETGFEFIVPASEAPGLWQDLLAGGRAAGLAPAGLGARDVLRVEAGLPLYGHEIDPATDPYEIGYAWTIDRREPGGARREFTGWRALVARREKVARRLVRFRVAGRQVPRPGFRIRRDGRDIGVVTSGTFSPRLGVGVGLGFVAPADAAAPGQIAVAVRDKLVPAGMY